MAYNEEALEYAYDDFKLGGYSKSKEEFIKLLGSNEEAFKMSYDSFKKNGYTKGANEYSILLGLKPAAQEDFPADVEVKEDPSQEGASVEGNVTASNGEGDSTVTPGAEELTVSLPGVDEEPADAATEKFVSLDNQEVVEEDMKLEQRQAENEARQNMSYEDWLDATDQGGAFSREVNTGIDILGGQFSSVFGSNGVISRAYRATGLGDDKKSEGMEGFYDNLPWHTPVSNPALFGAEQLLRATERSVAKEEIKEAAYNEWKAKYDDSIKDPTNISDQSTIEGYIENKINDGELYDEDGKLIKGALENKNNKTHKATSDQIEGLKTNEKIDGDYNKKRNRALVNKDKKGIKRYFGVEVSDEFLENYDVDKLTKEELNNPKFQTLLESLRNMSDLDDTAVQGAGGVSDTWIDTIFSGGAEDSVDQDDFMDWYNNNKDLQAQAALRYNIEEDEDGNKVYVPKHGFELGANDKWKASVISQYLGYKGKKLNNNYRIYKNLGVPELVNKINEFQTDAELLEKAFLPKYNKVVKMKGQLESGEVKNSQKNIDIYNALAKETNDLQDQYEAAHAKITKQLTPKNRELLDGFYGLNDEFVDFQKQNVRFLENTSFGADYKILLENQVANDDYYEKWGEIGIQESLETVWNKVIGFGSGIIDVANIPITDVKRLLGDDEAEEKALLFSDAMEGILSEHVKFTVGTKPFIDPVTSEINWSRALPNTIGTITDMALMIRGGKIPYRMLKTAGKTTKKGLLKLGVKPAKLENLGKYYKKGSSAVGTGLGSMPVLYPAKLDEALDQVSDEFTAEDAFDYAVHSATTEALIEVINPDFRWTRRSLADIRKALRKGATGDEILKAFKGSYKTALKESMKAVPKELLEEYTQMIANGSFAMANNRAFNTDFKIPDYAEAKETTLLTAFSVLGMRWGSGNLYTSNETSLMRVAAENHPAFTEALNKNMLLPKSDPKWMSEDAAKKLLKKVDNYVIVKGKVDDMIWDKDGNPLGKMTWEQHDRLIEKITTRMSIQARIEQNPDLKEELQKELDAINESINNERNVIEMESDQHKIQVNDVAIKTLKQKLESEAPTKEKTPSREGILEEIADLEKKNEKLKENTPEYTFNGKAYNNKADFLKAINTAKQNGSFKRGLKPNIKIKNDFDTEKEAYKILGKYAPKDVKGRIIMTNKDAFAAETFVDKRTDIELKEELKKELLKSKGQQNRKKIQQYKNALKYLALKKVNYNFGKPGFLVQPTVMSQNELKDLQLEGNIQAVKNATELFGGEMEVLSNDKALEKYGPQVWGANGFFAPKRDKDGNITGFVQVINRDQAKHMKAKSVASHEMLHNLLFTLINGPMRQIDDPMGVTEQNPTGKVWVKMSENGKKIIKGFLGKLSKEQVDVLNEKLDEGGYRFAKYDSNGVGVPETELSFEEYGEEYLNMFHDVTIKDKHPLFVDAPKSWWKKIINYFNNIFNSTAPELVNINIQDSQDLLNFLNAYNKQTIEEKFSDQVVEMGKKSLQDRKDILLADSKNTAFKKAMKNDPDGMVYSRNQKPLDLEAKSDLFSKTNEELSIALQAYGLEGEFDPTNEEHLDIWNGIPKQDKLFIGYSIGNLWRNHAGNKLFIQYGNTPNFKEYESDILDVLTTGTEVGQNGLPYIVSTWDPTQRKLTSHIWDLLPTRIPHVTRLPQFAGFGKSLDAQYNEEVNERVDDTPSKINVLKFEKVQDKTGKIKDIVKVKKGDTFKEVSDKHAGRVAQLIFGVPQAKIIDPKKNLTYAKRIVNGIPESSEAGNIQDFYRVGNNAEKLIKILPKESVSNETADINELGENIDVSRDVYGRGLGLSNRMLNYFYNKTNRRSKGLSSQPYIWELKPEFRKPSQETINKFKEDLGITPKGELNNYDRNIGQLLKGLAKFQGQQTALSTAQRILEPTIAEVREEQRQEVKQQLANIRAGQSSLAFSRNMKKVDQMIGMQYGFDMETVGIDKLLESLGKKASFNIKTEKGRKQFIEAIKKDLFPMFPQKFFFSYNKEGKVTSSIFTASNANYGLSISNAEEAIIHDAFKNEIFDLGNNSNIQYGEDIEGANWDLTKSYNTIFGKKDTYLSKMKDKKRIEEWNANVALIHKEMWSRFNEALKNDPNSDKAQLIGTYLKLVANDKQSWHRLGAQLDGYSTKLTKREDGTVNIEFEHAMPATAAYLYLLNSAINKDINFDVSYELVMDNYKLIVLDKAMDDKLRTARTKSGYSLQRRMPDNWSVLTNNWWERYFNDIVNDIENGIDPNSIVDLDGVTFAKKYDVKPVITKPGIKNNKRVSDAIMRSRTVNPTQGMSAWDLDDTLARTKSGVIYTIPNPSMTPQPGRKVIFMAGAPGSGKSTIIKGLGLNEQGFKTVNQDISLEWLMKNHGLPADMNDFTPEQASKFKELGFDASMIAKRKQTEFKGKGDGVVVDGTGNKLQEMQTQVQEFKNKGYDVQMVFVETSLETSLERNSKRKERSLTNSTVKRTHESVQKNKEAFKELFGNNFVEIKSDNLKQGDPIPSKTVSKVDGFTKGYVKGRLSAEEFANEGSNILEQGGEFDFSEFNIVKEGKQGPLFNKAMKRAKKYGLKDQYILTARPHAAKMAIYRFLDAQGLNIPLENIITLQDSTPEAKALWIADKVSEGYNDIYFADDALQNVQAVQNMLDQFDVKGRVQLAKIMFSKSINTKFNDILENVTGIESKKRFSAIKARKRGANKGKFRFFIPPSHEDFTGLLYNFMGKGKEGDAHRDFWETSLLKPLNRAYRELNTAKQAIANDYKQLNKQSPDIKKILNEKIDGDFTVQDAIRVYLWDKHGYKVPGLSPTDQQNLVEWVKSDSKTQTYAEILNTISKQENYVKPTESWTAGDIRTDLDDATGRVGRKQFFAEFNENAEIIFSEENLNKIEAAYGDGVVSAIKDILYRTKTGRNRPSGQNELTNRFMNYLNGSVAATMFINIRSAVLQQMSMVNFINFADNNILTAAKAFANQKQYWADWAMIFNSDFMKQRRGGIKTDINGAELAASLKGAKNTPRALLAKLLEFGFKPTQIGDNIAIATGGAPFLRNRINTYLKEGMTQKEAESKAWIDFQVLAEATQQSARPDMVSQQQASPLGKIILAFQNVTSQFNRLGKKAFQDIYNRRITPGNTTQLQSDMSNASRIAYYFAIQNLIFYSLQSALFMAAFDDDEDDERMLKKKERIINGTLDSVLRGSGVWGAVVATLKNMAIKYREQRERDWNGDESSVLVEMLNVSPPLGIKARKIVNAERTLNYNKSVIEEMETFDIDNPMWSAYTNYIESTTNIPLNRLYNKTQNVRESLRNHHSALQRVLMFSGWSKWNLGIGDSEKIIKIKETVKKKKKIISKEKSKIKKEQKEKKQEVENKVVIEENKEKSKKDGICSAISKGGKRCKYKAINGGFCTVHEPVPKSQDGKEVQCRKRKADGERCGMQTTNKSGYCYYHD